MTFLRDTAEFLSEPSNVGKPRDRSDDVIEQELEPPRVSVLCCVQDGQLGNLNLREDGFDSSVMVEV